MTDNVNILIVEDEAIVAMDLEDTLQTKDYRIAGIADNGREALSFIEKETIDLMLLDIQIKGDWDGIETARKLMSVKDIPFIYLTAFSDGETIERAKETKPAAYLIKPYQPRNLLVAIDLALHNFALRQTNPSKTIPITPRKQALQPIDQGEPILYFNEAIFIKQNYTFVKVNLRDIQYFEVDGNHSYIVTEAHKYILRHSLSAVLQKLNQPYFVRIHRSYAINIGCVDTFNDSSIFIGEQELPLGRHYKDAFLRHFDLL